jgi:hypothetical protein
LSLAREDLQIARLSIPREFFRPSAQPHGWKRLAAPDTTCPAITAITAITDVLHERSPTLGITQCG